MAPHPAMLNDTWDSEVPLLGLRAAFSSKEPQKTHRTDSLLSLGGDTPLHHSLFWHFALFIDRTSNFSM